MITYWRNKNGLTQLSHYEKKCWVHVEAPSDEECLFLVDRFNAPQDLLADILDANERSRYEVEEEWQLVILRIPIYLPQPVKNLPYVTVPLGILFSEKVTLSICVHRNRVMKDIIRLLKVEKLSLYRKTDVVAQIVLCSASWFMRYLKTINAETLEIEKNFEEATKNEKLHHLLYMEKCLVYFITSIKSNELLLEKIKNSQMAKTSAYDVDLMEDAVIENRQALEMANIYSDILSRMMHAFSSVISNNLNQIMRQLTSITIVLMIPTLVASLYGMNVANALESNPWAFPGIVGVSILLSFVVVYLLRKRNLF